MYDSTKTDGSPGPSILSETMTASTFVPVPGSPFSTSKTSAWDYLEFDGNTFFAAPPAPRYLLPLKTTNCESGLKRSLMGSYLGNTTILLLVITPTRDHQKRIKTPSRARNAT
ncbi:unnamed protein product [Phytophthora lilii]|uniref:Unnamed protein product n=1 Tax=Phytophthora lilii TaxID=2077276 RepID=A0A9W6WJ32_9STRA|nr:unnamed protein product [Phytophthora lilii]